jgi:hypothetical protein
LPFGKLQGPVSQEPRNGVFPISAGDDAVKVERVMDLSSLSLNNHADGLSTLVVADVDEEVPSGLVAQLP